MKKPYVLSTQQRLWSDWVYAQADLSFCWAHYSFVLPRKNSACCINQLTYFCFFCLTVCITWAASWQNQQNGMCTQISLVNCPVWSESSLSAWRKLGSLLPIERTLETLIRLGRCPGWSASSLGAQSFCWFCHGKLSACSAFEKHCFLNVLKCWNSFCYTWWLPYAWPACVASCAQMFHWYYLCLVLRVVFAKCSPEPKAHWWAYVCRHHLTVRWLSVVFSPHSFKHLFLRNHWAHWSQISHGFSMGCCWNGPGHMTKMAAMPIYGKKLKKSSSPELKGWWPWNLVCSIGCLSTTKFVQMKTLGWPWLILRQGQIWSLMLLYGKKGKTMDLSSVIWN